MRISTFILFTLHVVHWRRVVPPLSIDDRPALYIRSLSPPSCLSPLPNSYFTLFTSFLVTRSVVLAFHESIEAYRLAASPMAWSSSFAASRPGGPWYIVHDAVSLPVFSVACPSCVGPDCAFQHLPVVFAR